MALFNSRKQSDSAQPSPAATPSPAPDPTPTQPAQFSAAPLGAGLRLVSAPGATVTELPSPVAEPAHQEPRAEDLRGLPLGTILYRRGLVEQSDLEEALAAGMESGERLGEVLIRRALVSEEEIGRCLAAQQGLSFLNVGEFTVDPEAARLLPASEALELGALAVSMQDGVLLVVSPDPSAHQRGRLEAVLGHPVTEAVVSRAVFASLVEQVENGSVDVVPLEGAPEPVLQQHDEGWLVPQEDPDHAAEPSPLALEAVPTPEEEFSSFAEAAAEPDRPEPEEEPQMEAWTDIEEPETSEPAPAAWSQPAAEAASEQPAPELGSWHGDDTGTAHLEPVADEPFLEEPVAGLPSWDEPAAETAPEEHHPFAETFSAEPEPAATYDEPEQTAVSEGSVPDAGRIDELGAHHEASVGRIDELLTRIHEGAATYNGLRAQIGELTESLKTTEEALADREQRLGALTEEHEAAQRRIDELVGELHQRDEALSGLGERLEDLTGRLGSAEQRLDEREQRLAELDASLVERVRHVEELSAQVERRDHALSAFEEKLSAIATQFFADGAA